MKTNVGYKINIDLKEEYDGFIKDKYGHKKNRCGLELSNWMKLGLTVNGGFDYSDDPKVRELLEAAMNFQCTHTQSKNDTIDSNKKSSVEDDDRLEKLEREIKELKEQLAEQSKPAKRVNTDMDMFVQLFKDKYGNDEQVSMNDISKLIVKTHGVVDKRSIQNRVDYLMSSGCIESFAPNVFNVRF